MASSGISWQIRPGNIQSILKELSKNYQRISKAFASWRILENLEESWRILENLGESWWMLGGWAVCGIDWSHCRRWVANWMGRRFIFVLWRVSQQKFKWRCGPLPVGPDNAHWRTTEWTRLTCEPSSSFLTVQSGCHPIRLLTTTLQPPSLPPPPLPPAHFWVTTRFHHGYRQQMEPKISAPNFFLPRDSWGILWRFLEDSLGILWRFFGDSLKILGRIFGDSLEILGRFFGDSLEILGRFFGDSLEILWGFFGDSWKILRIFLRESF